MLWISLIFQVKAEVIARGEKKNSVFRDVTVLAPLVIFLFPLFETCFLPL